MYAHEHIRLPLPPAHHQPNRHDTTCKHAHAHTHTNSYPQLRLHRHGHHASVVHRCRVVCVWKTQIEHAIGQVWRITWPKFQDHVFEHSARHILHNSCTWLPSHCNFSSHIHDAAHVMNQNVVTWWRWTYKSWKYPLGHPRGLLRCS